MCSPWLFVVFVACAIAVLPALGVRPDFSNLWDVAATRIWNGHPTPGQEKFGVAHIMFFAWFANLAMHIALSDMALFRFAPNWKYGLFSAFGMYPGHMLAWICSGIMVAGINREMNPGMMAIQAGGIAGGAAVMIAGWTTANPTLYRSGLAFQAITPNWPRWKTTALAGTITTLLSCMPVFFLRLLDYVAIYGLALMPVGAIVVAEHWIFPRLGIEQYSAERRGWTMNWAALARMGGNAGVLLLTSHPSLLQVAARVLLCVGGVHGGFGIDAPHAGAELFEGSTGMITRVLAALSLVVCLAMSYLFFTGRVSEGGYKTVFALASLAWFVLATIAIRRRSQA